MGFSILDEQYLILSIITVCVALLTVIVSVIIFIVQSNGKKKETLHNHFEEIYKECFKLRESISKKLGIDWYYDVGSLMNNEKAYEEVLNHINKLCSLFSSFFVVGAKRLWKKLMPIKLFNRLLALYPVILYSRRQNNDPKKFKDYEKVILSCIKSKDIYSHYKFNIKKPFGFGKEKNFIWTGTRDSDVKYSKDSVKYKVSIFGKEVKGIRQNHNIKDFNNYLMEETEKLIRADKNAAVMLYNPIIAYLLPLRERERVVCLNNENILLNLNDKLYVRQTFGQIVSCVPYIEVKSSNLNFNKLTQYFSTNKIVVQGTRGSGGYSTYVADENNQKSLIAQLKEQVATFLVSPYIDKSVSVNVHIIVCEKQSIIFPASVQLIENYDNKLLYRGADFVSFRDLGYELKEKINKMAVKIANKLRELGYYGIAGIDMLVYADEPHLVEINPRFQASSFILDKYISEKYSNEYNNTDPNKKRKERKIPAKNILDLNYNAFKGVANTDISFYDEINYSCYFYFPDGHCRDDIDYKLELLKNSCAEVDLDGYDSSCETDGDSYLFRALFKGKISQISPDGDLWISDNVKFNENPNDDVLKLKISLLNQGVRLKYDDEFKYKEAVFDAVDFKVGKYNMYVNSPIKNKYVELSPYEIDCKGNNGRLLFNGKEVSDIEIESEKITEKDKYPERKSLYISTDRLRITPAKGCQFKSQGLGCRFCNMVPYSGQYSIRELEQAYDFGKTKNPRHVMIGGGSVVSEINLNLITQLATYIQSRGSTEITLMSLPQKADDLIILQKSGITDVSFNIEIFDEQCAAKYMPAKSQFSRSYYFNILNKATQVWPGYGNVRSLVMVGLEKTDSLYKGINMLKKIKVQPVLSVFRPMEDTPLEDRLPPTNSYLETIYNDICKILYPLTPGPKCDMCKNNILAI